MAVTVKGDFSKLENLLKGLKTKMSVRVGVFQEATTPDGQSVAEYGAYNEFGSVSVPDRPPKRSFIRMPIETKAEKIAADVEKRKRDRIEQGNIRGIFEDIGLAAEAVIQEAFDTRGFGTWKENAEMTIEKKGSDAPLIDEGLLRRSITSKVVDK
jgi:hypothetical protein